MTQPPPYAADPSQPGAQLGYGQQPPPQPGYGPPPGQQQGTPLPAGEPVPYQQPRKPWWKGVGGRLIGVGIAIAVIAGGGYAWKHLSGDPTIANTGDCVTNASDVDDVKVVDCDSAEAAFRVVKRVDDLSGGGPAVADFACEGTEATQWLAQTKNGNFELVLCLAPV